MLTFLKKYRKLPIVRWHITISGKFRKGSPFPT